MNIGYEENSECQCAIKMKAKIRFLTHGITAAEEGRSVQSILKNEMRLSSGLTARLKRVENGILLNGEKVFSNVRVSTGDIVSAAIGFCPERHGALPFKILFEDDDLLIINKPAGAAVHGSQYDASVPSIERCVNEYYGGAGFFHPVSRLDRGTTGVMTIAKNGYVHERLSAALHTDDYKRYYVGICDGWLAADTGIIDLPIKREDGPSVRRIIAPDGAAAITEFRRLAENGGAAVENAVIKTETDVLKYGSCGGFAAVEFRLQTGRTHQIRVHSAAVGHPLVGDWLYGREAPEIIDRPALHSRRLELVHPVSAERLVIEAEIPSDMRRLLDGSKTKY